MAGIEYVRAGEGSPPFVFVHGFGCAREDWAAHVAHLSPRHTTIAVDLGGHGKSPSTPEHGRIETHGGDVAALVGSLALPPAVLVGHSMGCRVVLQAAMDAPKSVLGVVLVDGSRLGMPGANTHEATRRQIEETGYQVFIRPLFAAMFSPRYDAAKAQPLIERAAALRPELGTALFADIGRWDSENLDTVLGKLHVPLMVVQTTYQDEKRQRRSLAKGQSSPFLDYVRSKVPAARIEVIPDIGHFPQLEAPEALNGLLDSFAQSLKSR
jgi:pimeloyl-ACP methyl ester carboxylesterase